MLTVACARSGQPGSRGRDAKQFVSPPAKIARRGGDERRPAAARCRGLPRCRRPRRRGARFSVKSGRAARAGEAATRERALHLRRAAFDVEPLVGAASPRPASGHGAARRRRRSAARRRPSRGELRRRSARRRRGPAPATSSPQPRALLQQRDADAAVARGRARAAQKQPRGSSWSRWRASIKLCVSATKRDRRPRRAFLACLRALCLQRSSFNYSATASRARRRANGLLRPVADTELWRSRWSPKTSPIAHPATIRVRPRPRRFV